MHVVDYVRMRVYLCIPTTELSARLTISSYVHHSLACLTKADGANADGLFSNTKIKCRQPLYPWSKESPTIVALTCCKLWR